MRHKGPSSRTVAGFLSVHDFNEAVAMDLK